MFPLHYFSLTERTGRILCQLCFGGRVKEVTVVPKHYLLSCCQAIFSSLAFQHVPGATPHGMRGQNQTAKGLVGFLASQPEVSRAVLRNNPCCRGGSSCHCTVSVCSFKSKVHTLAYYRYCYGQTVCLSQAMFNQLKLISFNICDVRGLL